MNALFKVKRFILSNHLIKEKERVLLAVSGGPDSMALLSIMKDLSEILGFEVGVAHIDHKIRINSHKDAEFVEDECKKYGVPFYGRDIYLFDGSKRDKKSLEQKAREQRYAALFSIAKEYGYDLIATGHTKSDQAETILMRIITGTSIKSLSGILAIRDERIIRPLLILSREEIMDYLKEHNIKFVEDITNRDRKYLRNKVRLDLIPFLKREFNPNIEEALSMLAEEAYTIRGLVYSTLSPHLDSVRYDEGQNIARFSKETFLGVPEGLRRHFIVEIISNLGVDRRIDSDNLRSAIDFICQAKGSRYYRISSELVIRFEYGTVEIGRFPDIKQIEADLENFDPVVVRRFGRYKIPWVDIEFKVVEGIEEDRRYPHIVISRDKFDFPFVVRVFKEGDKIYSSYYKRDVKLKKIFINKKIPLRLRRILPILTAQDEILFVPGVIRSGIGKLQKGEEGVTFVFYNFEPDLIKYLGPYNEMNIVDEM